MSTHNILDDIRNRHELMLGVYGATPSLSLNRTNRNSNPPISPNSFGRFGVKGSSDEFVVGDADESRTRETDRTDTVTITTETFEQSNANIGAFGVKFVLPVHTARGNSQVLVDSAFSVVDDIGSSQNDLEDELAVMLNASRSREYEDTGSNADSSESETKSIGCIGTNEWGDVVHQTWKRDSHVDYEEPPSTANKGMVLPPTPTHISVSSSSITHYHGLRSHPSPRFCLGSPLFSSSLLFDSPVTSLSVHTLAHDLNTSYNAVATKRGNARASCLPGSDTASATDPSHDKLDIKSTSRDRLGAYKRLLTLRRSLELHVSSAIARVSHLLPASSMDASADDPNVQSADHAISLSTVLQLPMADPGGVADLIKRFRKMVDDVRSDDAYVKELELSIIGIERAIDVERFRFKSAMTRLHEEQSRLEALLSGRLDARSSPLVPTRASLYQDARSLHSKSLRPKTAHTSRPSQLKDNRVPVSISSSSSSATSTSPTLSSTSSTSSPPSLRGQPTLRRPTTASLPLPSVRTDSTLTNSPSSSSFPNTTTSSHENDSSFDEDGGDDGDDDGDDVDDVLGARADDLNDVGALHTDDCKVTHLSPASVIPSPLDRMSQIRLEVGHIDRVLFSIGGESGGWSVDDHVEFVKEFNHNKQSLIGWLSEAVAEYASETTGVLTVPRHTGSDDTSTAPMTLVRRISSQLPHIPLADIAEHVLHYRKYLALTQRKRVLLSDHRAEKNAERLRRLSESMAKEEAEKQQVEQTKRIEEQLRRKKTLTLVKNWREKKLQEMARLREEEKAKRRDLELKDRLKREEEALAAKRALDEYRKQREEKERQEEEKRLEMAKDRSDTEREKEREKKERFRAIAAMNDDLIDKYRADAERRREKQMERERRERHLVEMSKRRMSQVISRDSDRIVMKTSAWDAREELHRQAIVRDREEKLAREKAGLKDTMLGRHEPSRVAVPTWRKDLK